MTVAYACRLLSLICPAPHIEPRLLVDTGDLTLDAALAGHVRVRTGPRQSMGMRLEP